jgi:hypothetical protein
MQTSHLQNVYGTTMTIFHFPKTIPATPVL